MKGARFLPSHHLSEFFRGQVDAGTGFARRRALRARAPTGLTVAHAAEEQVADFTQLALFWCFVHGAAVL